MRYNPVSFILPCLNEESQLEEVIKSIQSLSHHFLEFEIILADNGSTDSSVEIAKKLGVRIVHVQEKGYGNALRSGIIQARFDTICFGDADQTYCFSDSLDLLKKLIEEDCSLVVGDRLKGRMERGAMPLMHQYFGTPFISFLVNKLFVKNQESINDINCGLRVFKKEDFLKLTFSTTGMEFASEMIIRYLKSNYQVRTIPVSLSVGNRNRVPHLRPIRDGIRHLKLIIKEAAER